MRVRCNAGITEVNQVGHKAGYCNVWYDDGAVSNILSLRRVTSRFPVTFNSCESDEFVVHLPNGRTRRFQQTRRSLYASQLVRRGTATKNVTLKISTVEGNKR